MIGLDTNVLVRLLVDDDEEQAQRAVDLIETQSARGERLFISDVVLCELVWVLKRAYQTPKPTIVRALDGVLRGAQFAFEDVTRVRRALGRYESGSAGFADYLVAEVCADAGCDRVYTFDNTLLREDGFFAS